MTWLSLRPCASALHLFSPPLLKQNGQQDREYEENKRPEETPCYPLADSAHGCTNPFSVENPQPNRGSVRNNPAHYGPGIMDKG